MSYYPPLLVKPMREEMVAMGFEELTTADEVDGFIAEKSGTALLVVNSVCGCAAGMARPGIRLALEKGIRPDHLATVFAGVDLEATERARGHMSQYPPSSPSMALLKDGEVVHFVPRHQIEGRTAELVAGSLAEALEAHCAIV